MLRNLSLAEVLLAGRDTWEEVSKRIGKDLRLDALPICLLADEAMEISTGESCIGF